MKNIFLTGLFSLLLVNASAQSVTPEWTFQTGDPVLSSPVSAEGSVFVGSDGGTMYCLEGTDGELKWSTKVDGEIRCEPAIQDEMLIFTTGAGSVYALHQTTGEKIWQFAMGEEQKKDMWDYFYSSPVVHQGNVYVGCGNGKLFSLAASTGKKNFVFTTEGIVHVKPVIYNNLVCFGSYDGFFYAVNTTDGTLAWKFDTYGHEYFKKGAVQNNAGVVGNTILFGSRDFKVYALDGTSGQEKWNMHEKGSWVSAPMTVDGQSVYFGTSDSHHFYKLNSNDGSVTWQSNVPLNIFGGATKVEDVVYVGCLDGCLYGFSTKNGERVFQFATPANKKNAQLLLDANDKIDREKLKQYKTGEQLYGDIYSMGSIFGTPLYFRDKLVFGSYEGVIYAVPVD
jgi:outer membrane protein assembly factor BamB